MEIKPLKILYEDNHLIVVEKPVNLPTQADQSGDPDLQTRIKKYLKVTYHKPGNVYLGLVHRLDRPVGGVMVFAKTSKAASRLSQQLRERRLKKTYLAVAHGRISVERGRLTDWLLKDRLANQVAVVAPGSSGAKEAILDYEVRAQVSGFSLVQIALETGRSHQIRVQLAHQGYPLFGDQKYGAAVNRPGQQLALWSARLAFTHPIRGEAVIVDSLPAPDFPWHLFSSENFVIR